MMKLFVATIATLLSVHAMAQGNRYESSQSLQTRQEFEQPRLVNYSSKGFRMALVKPILSLQARADGYSKTSALEKLPETLGLSLGYARLPIGHLGWSANFAYINIQNVPDQGFWRLDGNVGYTANSLFSIKGGLNISNLTRTAGVISPSAGAQTSIGLQFNKTVGIDLGYVMMQQQITILDYDTGIYIVEQGPEITLTVTL